MLIAEGILFDTKVIKEGVAVCQLIKRVCLGSIGRSKSADEAALFQLFQNSGESAAVGEFAFT